MQEFLIAIRVIIRFFKITAPTNFVTQILVTIFGMEEIIIIPLATQEAETRSQKICSVWIIQYDY